MNKYFHDLLIGVSVLPALLIAPSMAADPVTDVPVFVFGDVVFDAQDVDVGQAAFGGRRMNVWSGNKYQNDFPKYKMEGRSLTITNSDIYVGPVSLKMKDLGSNDVFKFNYQWTVEGDPETDIDLAEWAGVVWNDAYGTDEDDAEDGTVYGKLNDVITVANANYTVPAVYAMSRRDNSKTAGLMSFDNTTAMIDGAKIEADTISVTGGSVLTFVKQDHSKLGAFLNGDIDSDGITKLNANILNIDGSEMVVKPGAKLVINSEKAAGATTIKNVVSDYGALTVNGSGSIEIDGNSLAFNNNKSTSHGAGLYYKDQTYGNGNTHGTEAVVLNAKNITFSGNEVANKTGVQYTSGSGSAVFVSGGNVSILGEKNIFQNNKMKATVDPTRLYKTGGGAIANQSYDKESNPNKGAPIDATMVVGKADGSSVNTFTGNTSTTYGGAVMNRAIQTDGNAEMTINGTTMFSNNHADLGGGAIYNVARQDANTLRTASDAKLVINGNTTFSGNIAGTDGGAIYNTGLVVLAGTHNFTGNTADDLANDIHNLGTLTVASGTTTMDGGITGTGALNIEDGATLNIGTASIVQGSIDIASGGTLIATVRSGDAQFDVADSFEGEGTLSLVFNGEGTYKVFGDEVFANAKEQVKSSIYDIEWVNGDKDIKVALKSVADMAAQNNIAQDTALTVAAASQSSSAKLKDFSEKVQAGLASGDAGAKAEIEHATKAINPETKSVAQSVSTSIQSAVANLAGARMSVPMAGRNGGDVNLTGGGVWVQGLYNKTKQNDAFNGYTRGLAVGLDGTINNDWMVGMGYAYATSDVAGSARDTDVESNTVFVYGQYKPSDWYVNAVLNYTMSDYTEKGMALGTPVSADYGLDSFGGRIATGYDFAGGITPELGLRYMHVNAETYTNSMDVTNRIDSADYLTATLGTKYGFNMMFDKLLVRPELRYAVMYDMISDDNMTFVTMPGTAAYTLTGERLSRIGGEFGIGLGMKYKSADVSLNYDIEVREDYTSQTGRLKFRYEF